MALEKKSPCKVNLLLNILGRRPDGFHELETVLQPVALHDVLTFDSAPASLQLTCSDPRLPVDGKNLVHRAATGFLAAAGLDTGLRIHLQKNIPLEAGLGGGSANAAVTLLALNEMFASPLAPARLHALAASLGSDVPFFLQDKPALATGRGEKVEALDFFPALRGAFIFLVHPGFGISTAWSYQQLAHFPGALNGRPGRGTRLVELLQSKSISEASAEIYNSLESPALEKFPLLDLFKKFFMENGASAALMSGSGSTTFALVENEKVGVKLRDAFVARFGTHLWTALLPVAKV